MKQAIMASAFFAVTALATGGSQAIELASSFEGYQNGCDVKGNEGTAVLNWLIPKSANGTIGKSPVLPADLAPAFGKPSVDSKGDHWMVSVPMSNATFNGVPVTKMQRWSGKDNGIAGWSFDLAAPVNTVKMAFKGEKFKADEIGSKPQIVKSAGNASSLVCDSSN